MASYGSGNGPTAYPSYGQQGSYGYGVPVQQDASMNNQSSSNNGGGGASLRRRGGPAVPEPSSFGDSTNRRSGSSVVKKLDFMFTKVEKDYTVTTERGGVTTMAAVFLIVLLSLGEITSWLSENASTKEHMAVNRELNKRMRINMNITFPALACEDLHVDAMDVAGDSQIDVEDTLVKKQLMLDGTPRSLEEIKVETNKHQEEQEQKEKLLKEKLPKDYCGPCFGAQENDDQCCQTCDEVLAAYKTKRWKSDLLQYTAEQCVREGRDKKEPKKMRKGQGWGRGIKADVKRTIARHWREEMTNFNGKVCVVVRC